MDHKRTREVVGGFLAIVLLNSVSAQNLNPILTELPDNTWVYMNPEPSLRYFPVFRDPEATEALTDKDRVATREPQGRSYTGVVYGDNKIFYFGGAHRSYPGNDVEIYDIARNVWTQSYKPEVPPANDPVYGSGGSENISPTAKPYTLHGYARTTYNPAFKRYICTASFSLASYDPTANQWYWLAGKYAPNSQPPHPNNIADLSQWDQGLGGILGFSSGSSSQIWLFRNGVWTQHDYVNATLAGNGGSASVYIHTLRSHLIALMPQGNCCGSYSQGRLYLYNSVTKRLKEITSMPIALKEQFYPEGNFVMAYDTLNKKVVGFSAQDKGLKASSRIQTWIYDPFKDIWEQLPISNSSPLVPGFSATNRSPFQYDPVHNVFIFVFPKRIHQDGEVGFVETWAYRYKKSSGPPTGVGRQGEQIPLKHELYQNFPNPFNPNTTIRYALSEESEVTLKIYDIQGNPVTTLVNAVQNIGIHETKWGEGTASGVYFCKLQVRAKEDGRTRYSDVRKMLLLH